MEAVTYEGINLELMRGDIANQKDMDAVVNAANAQLKMGGGVAGAIHRGAGPELETETRALAPIEPGEAVITDGHNLPNRFIIHTLGPVYGQDQPEDELLARCYENSLKLADQKGIRSIAFPAISTGAFGYPTREAAEVALKTVKKMMGQLKKVEKIRFVLWGEEMFNIHEEVADETF